VEQASLITAKGQHFEHLLFMISCIVWRAEMFKITLIISKDCKKLHCRIYVADRHALFCNDAVVALATTQVVLSQNQTFWARLVGNSFMIFSARNYASPACVGKVMLKIMRVWFFETWHRGKAKRVPGWQYS